MALSRADVAQIVHLLRPLSNRTLNMVARATVKVTDDGGKLQLLQIDGFDGGPVDGAMHFQSYGFSSVPLEGAEAIAVFPGGNHEHPLVVAVADRRWRPVAGQPGEVTVYNNTGASITITKDGDIVATPAPGRSFLGGGQTASDKAAGENALTEFMNVLGTTSDSAGACAALHAALSSASWPANYVASKVKIQ